MALSREIIEEQLSSVIGSENVITNPETLENYSKDHSFVSPRKPLLVVQPKTIEEVQQIIKFANRVELPVVPYSSGKNNQGSCIPSYPGIVMDLSQMNRILWTELGSRNACVEPGVTFAQLQDEAKKHGLRALTPMELPASSSVISSYLDLVPLYSWSKYGTENILTMEVVLGTGEIMQTGIWGGAPGVDRRIAIFHHGSFAYLDSCWRGSQGTLGVVTSGVVKLKSIQEANRVYFVPLDKVEESFQLIRKIKYVGFWHTPQEELFVANNTELAAILADKWPNEFNDVRKALSPWTLVTILRGTNEYVDIQEEELKDAASEIGITFERDLPGVENAGEKLLKEIEYPQGYEKMSRYKGARNTIPFMTQIKRVPMYNQIVFGLCNKHKYPIEDLGCLMLPVEIAHVSYQYSLNRNPDDPEDTEKVKGLYFEAINNLWKTMPSAYFSRPYGPLAEKVFSRAGIYNKYLKKLKEIVDPKNILNPGKLGF